VSDLFDVSSHSTVEELSRKTEIRIPWGHGIVGFVALSGTSLNIPDCYEDQRFNQEVDVLTGYRTRSMLCHPIKDATGEVIGVAQVINKANEGHFTRNDEVVFEKYLQFCGIGLRNAQLYERSQLEVKRNQVLLDLAGVIFQEQSTIDMLIFRILTHMLSLIRCDRAMLLLMHEASQSTTFSRVFDLEAADLDDEAVRAPFEGRFPVNAGITGYVAATGETVNIADAWTDSRFDQTVDTGAFRHRGILCMPIRYNNRRPLGVFQLVNKFDQLTFTKNDEHFVEAFAIYCGMGITNVRMYERAVVAMAKQQVTLEVLSYHATAPLEEAARLARQKVPSAGSLRLHHFAFNDFALNDNDTLKVRDVSPRPPRGGERPQARKHAWGASAGCQRHALIISSQRPFGWCWWSHTRAHRRRSLKGWRRRQSALLRNVQPSICRFVSARRCGLFLSRAATHWRSGPRSPPRLPRRHVLQTN
jgi:dual 3',5'-cyclic-AMP and -GMP phosphodiesterase 11